VFQNIFLFLLEVVGLRVTNQNFRASDSLMSTLNVKYSYLLDALRWQMPSTVIPIYAQHVRPPSI